MSTSSTLRNPHAPFPPALQSALDADVGRALAEDVGTGDLTGLLIPEDRIEAARVIVREPAVLCGASWFEAVMHRVDARILLDWAYAEGDLMEADSVVCRLHGPVRARCRGGCRRRLPAGRGRRSARPPRPGRPG